MKASKITKYTAAAALTILLGSCAKVEDSASGTKLIPIELKVSIEPATRSLHTKKSWNPGKDHILVSTYQTNYGDFSFGEYLVIDTEGNTKAIQPAVRKTKEYDYAPQTRIYAFYWPAGSRDKKVNLQDQSTPQLLEAVDILEATPSKGSEDLQPEGVATVSFYHALARIRLVLDKATIDASEVTEVLVASDTEASIGTRWQSGGAILTLEYSNPGWISMCRDTDEPNVFEALVAPTPGYKHRLGGEQIKVRFRNQESGEPSEFSVLFDDATKLEGDKTYEYTISR